MTPLAQVTALVDAHVKRDQARFRAVTLQIAANLAARSERGADQLRKLVDQQVAVSFAPLPSATGLLSVLSELSTLDDMVLASRARDRIDRVVLEQTRKNDLLTLGLHPARKLLFTGAPGVGKTMAAGALAQAVGLPMFRVEMHGVIQSHLGETAGKLAQVFEHVRTMPAVYLFDEFDAIGADRSSGDGSASCSEMRRVVNSLLQFIEDDRSDSMIIAATNHEKMLDSALFRRFDEIITFGLPSREELIMLVRRSLSDEVFDFDVIYGVLTRLKLGHADVCDALDRARKDYLLVGIPIDTVSFIEALERRIGRGEES
jgi:SpoVK/Ycf46/Vps4 family AAA+-type ATPase